MVRRSAELTPFVCLLPTVPLPPCLVSVSLPLSRPLPLCALSAVGYASKPPARKLPA